jgi:hypothetical protein
MLGQEDRGAELRVELCVKIVRGDPQVPAEVSQGRAGDLKDVAGFHDA